VNDPFMTNGSTKGGKTKGSDRAGKGSRPLPHRKGAEIQPFGTIRMLPIALDRTAREESCRILNDILADSMILHAHYKKHHWHVRGHTFYQLHLLFDKHAEEQEELIDMIAERIQLLGGIAVGDPRHAAELTGIPRPPDGAEEIPAMLSRLLEDHEITITRIREGIEITDRNGDGGTNDLLMSDVLRTHELQVWFIAEHLVDTPAVRV
jgi:starvation-inducible DNA-binding protein